MVKFLQKIFLYELFKESLSLFGINENGITKKISLFCKINSLFLSCFFFYGAFICFPMIIFTDANHFDCTSDGHCSFYSSFETKTHKREVNFILANDSNIRCEINKKEFNKNYYKLIINNENNRYEIPQNPRTLDIKRCELYKSILEDNLKKDDKTIKYTHYLNKPVPWFGYIIYLYMVIGTCWTIYFTYIVFTAKKLSDKHIDNKA